jgi:hypothetical protein
MHIPDCTISSRPRHHCVYAACDGDYFEQFAGTLARSVIAHTDLNIHFHVFDPHSEQLDWCAAQPRITYSHETVLAEWFEPAAKYWQTSSLDPVQQNHLDRTRNAMNKGRDRNLQHRLQKTYYACVRFVRLAELFDPAFHMFAMDVDAVVRAPLLSPGAEHRFYIHRILGRRARYLAGGIWLNSFVDNQIFLTEYSEAICDYFDRDYVYWGIDQDVLEHVIPRHDHGELPRGYIDWDMQDSSAVWTAKGSRKDLEIFRKELGRYH